MHTILNIIDSVIKYLIRFSFFINNDNNDNKFATREPENDNEKWWYVAFAGDKAIQLLKGNLLKQNNRRPVYKSYYLSTICYGKHKSKKEYLTYLLNELNNKSK